MSEEQESSSSSPTISDVSPLSAPSSANSEGVGGGYFQVYIPFTTGDTVANLKNGVVIRQVTYTDNTTRETESFTSKYCPHTSKEERKPIENEINLLDYQLRGCKNILQLKLVYEGSNAMHIVYEQLCEGGMLLKRVVQMGERYSEKVAADIFRKIAGILSTFHEKKLIHRELTTDCFLFSSKEENSMLNVLNFSGAILLEKEEDTCKGRYGSVPYLAPEMVNLESEHGLESNIWSAGVILCVLLTGAPPFTEDMNEEIALEEIQHFKIDFSSDDIWGHVSNDARHLISEMLKEDPKQRIHAADILNHPWIRECNEISDKPMPTSVMRRMARFKVYYAQKVLPLKLIMETLSIEEKEGLKETVKDTADEENKITLENLTSALNEWGLKLRWKPQFDLSDVQHFFRRMDGAISYDEFEWKINKQHLKAIMCALSEKAVARLREMIKDATDTDCRITLEKLTSVINEWDFVEKWEGEISYDEFEEFLSKLRKGKVVSVSH